MMNATMIATTAAPTDPRHEFPAPTSEAGVKNLADLKAWETPMGFRDFTAEQIPIGYRKTTSTGNIVPKSMSSGSHSARRAYFEIVDGRLVEIGVNHDDAASTVSELSDEAKEETQTGNKREREEDSDNEEEEETQENKKPFVCKTRCGKNAGSAQCMCLVCMGYLDSDEDE